MEEKDNMEAMYIAAVRQLRTIVFEINYITGKNYCSPLFDEFFGISTIPSEDFTVNEETRKILYEEDIELYKSLFIKKDGERSVICRFVTKEVR